MKAVFIKKISGSNLGVCPFIGYRVSSIEEFISLIKTFYNKESGYPGLMVSLKNKKTLVFSGHEFDHKEEGPWWIFDPAEDDPSWEDIKFFSIKKETFWFDLLPDAEEVNKQLEILGELLTTTGVYIKLR